jgi:penicillin-binding protein 2
VVLDPTTGEILAIASYPTYDLSRFYIDYNILKADTVMNPLVSRATAGLYAPGSCFKPTVAVAALSDGVISTDSHVTCGGRYTYFSAYQPRCMGVHGSMGVISALKVSCNVFFFDVGRRLGIDRMFETANQLGLGVYTGIETGEKEGQITHPSLREQRGKPWYAGDVIQAAIGQSDTAVTPLQIATYCAALSQDGVRYRTHIIKETQNFLSGETISTVQPIVAATSPLSPEAFETVRRGMVAASGQGGTAANAFLGYPVSVASKTGTAETGRASNNALFITYAPSENPQIAIAIVVEKGGHGYFLTRFARDILDFWLFPGTRGAAGSGEGASSEAVTPGGRGESASSETVPPVNPGTAD